ncbi:TetR/AcrR family transcriptional regulator [Nocardia rhizosphaerae]|uniref:TetR/AcrR family transcriptional regulator n=1 Tax=Nocardia rhizosphaerae TaxID=1691571 RepID=A0ABV8LDR5_9NOCA
MAEKTSASSDTRERLLSAAERLLSTERFEEVSVRGICVEAGTNPAAVHYHFGSKDALVAALIEDRLGPLWADRLSVVAAVSATVVEVVDAVLEPFVELSADPLGRLHLRLLAQFVLGGHQVSWHRPWFRLESWVGLLPELAEAESRRRWTLAFQLIIMRFGGTEPRGREMSEREVATLRDFVVAGLSAPSGNEE